MASTEGSSSAGDGGAQAVPAVVNNIIQRRLKRTLDVFAPNHAKALPQEPESQKRRIAYKVHAEYAHVQTATQDGASGASAAPEAPAAATTTTSAATASGGAGGGAGAAAAAAGSDKPSHLSKAIDAAIKETGVVKKAPSTALVQYTASKVPQEGKVHSRALVAKRKPTKVPKPKWHAPWKLMRVISGHMGWVRSVAVEPGNKWFATGAGDRTIKIWDLASGTLKLTLTGHISAVRGLAISPRHPYMFSAGEDKMVKCWDLEYNKVIRSYHGHLSGVYSLALHPTLDILITGGRDSVARVWDMRTKQQIHVLGGHGNTVASIITNPTDPQVITGSMDTTVQLWDLAAGKPLAKLTHHKKSVRALAGHPRQFTFVSGGADNIKKWQCPEGKFLHNLSGHRSIINALAVNDDDVLVSAGDDGSLKFWDYTTGYNFGETETVVQPGSLDSEAGIYAMAFDVTGSRLITTEADKTIKIWREDPDATPDTHPIDMQAWTKEVRRHKRF